MADQPGTGGEGVAGPQKPLGDNPMIKFVQKPRPMLVLLALWSILVTLAETITTSGFFTEGPRELDLRMDGALAGLTLGWQGLALAALYLYCARDPVRYQRIFWLALVHMAALFLSIIYHWFISDVITGSSALIPLIGTGALATLVFLHLFETREPSAPGPGASPADD